MFAGFSAFMLSKMGFWKKMSMTTLTTTALNAKKAAAEGCS